MWFLSNIMMDSSREITIHFLCSINKNKVGHLHRHPTSNINLTSFHYERQNFYSNEVADIHIGATLIHRNV